MGWVQYVPPVAGEWGNMRSRCLRKFLSRQGLGRA